jgi:hypothetical protein
MSTKSLIRSFLREETLQLLLVLMQQEIKGPGHFKLSFSLSRKKVAVNIVGK